MGGVMKAALNAMPRAERDYARAALLCVSEETVLSAPEGAMLYSFASDVPEAWDGADSLQVNQRAGASPGFFGSLRQFSRIFFLNSSTAATKSSAAHPKTHARCGRMAA